MISISAIGVCSARSNLYSFLSSAQETRMVRSLQFAWASMTQNNLVRLCSVLVPLLPCCMRRLKIGNLPMVRSGILAMVDALFRFGDESICRWVDLLFVYSDHARILDWDVDLRFEQLLPFTIDTIYELNDSVQRTVHEEPGHKPSGSCGDCGSVDAPLKKCEQCEVIYYCSEVCEQFWLHCRINTDWHRRNARIETGRSQIIVRSASHWSIFVDSFSMTGLNIRAISNFL